MFPIMNGDPGRYSTRMTRRIRAHMASPQYGRHSMIWKISPVMPVGYSSMKAE